MEKDLRQLNTALLEADRRKDEFLALLGHELRNPLGALGGAVGVLNLAAKVEEPQQRAREVIGRQFQHLVRLVDDLLDMARIRTGKITLRRQPLDLSGCVSNLMSVMRSAGRFDAHVVTADLSSVWINGDEARIAQVVANLAGNALKYTPVGGRVVVRVSRPTVHSPASKWRTQVSGSRPG